MNWDAVSFDWNQVRAFLAAAEEGSLSAAARALRTTQPTIGRQVSELERQLGVTLIERSVRGLRLTETGETLLHHVRGMGDAARLLSIVAAGRSGDVSGTVRITASDMMSADLMPELLRGVQAENPGLRLEVLPSNDIKDLLEREADIAVRHMRPEQPELIARHVGDVRAHLYAATRYLDRAGRPEAPRDLADHAFVGIPDPHPIIATLGQLGAPLTPENFRIASDSGIVMASFVRAGYGLSLLPAAHCDRDPALERVLPELPTPSFPIWLVTHRELRTNIGIRAVFDGLARGLQEASREAGA